MAGVAAALIGGGLGFLGGLLDDSDTDVANIGAGASTESAKIMSRKAYPGQRDLATKIAPYLWEHIDTGLTETDKQIYRGAGRTSVSQALKSAGGIASRKASSQGLKGGSIANILAEIESRKATGFAGIESDIAVKDIERKKSRVQELLAFLALQAGNEPGAGGGGTGGGSIGNILARGGGGGGSADYSVNAPGSDYTAGADYSDVSGPGLADVLASGGSAADWFSQQFSGPDTYGTDTYDIDYGTEVSGGFDASDFDWG